MKTESPLRGVIFDYGNTLVTVDPRLGSKRADYADVVALPGAARLEGYLRSQGLLDGLDEAGALFVRRFLEVRERNRERADATGIEVTAAESLEETLSMLGARTLPVDERRRALAEFFAPEMEAVVSIKGAGETLAELEAHGLKLALLSNATDADYVTETIRRLGWLQRFDPFVVSAAIGYRKPRREAFDAVLTRWPFEPGEIAMVGDSLYHDVGGAAGCGLFTVHFTAIPRTHDEGRVVPALSVASHAALTGALLERAP